jgi:hypothetical protein
VFRPNETHRQQDLFSIETQLGPELRKRLYGSREYEFYKRVFSRIPEPLFADLYADQPASRPNVPVNTLVGALLLQHMYDWTFEELLDRVAFDLKVRAALGLWSLDEAPFCRATLFNFQKRLRDHMVASGQDKFQGVFDRLSQADLEEFGLSARIQRCDSTQLGSNIRDYTRIELLVEVVLRMWRILGEADQAQHRERFGRFVDAKTSGQFLYRLRRSDIDTALEQLARLYAWMVEALQGGYGSTEIHRIVCRVFAEHFTLVEERIAVRPAEEVASGSLQSPDDPEATYRNKAETFCKGYVLHVAETATPENDLQLITDVAVAPNNVEDGRILNGRLAEMHRKTPELEELHTDGAYGSEDNDRQLGKLEILAVQTGIRGPSARAPIRVERDEAGLLHVRCAAGHQVAAVSAKKHHKAEFAAAHCEGCPFAAVCRAQRRSHGRRTFYFTEEEAVKWLRHYRIETLPPERQALRANVEATIRQFKAPCRSGKLRTRGLNAMRRYAFLRAAAINFGRVYRYLQRRTAQQEPSAPVPAPSHPRPALRTGLLALLRRKLRVRETYRGIQTAASTVFA